MRLPPLSVLSSWPAPNYVDPVTRGNASLIVNIIFILFVLLAVGLRFYCRASAGAMRLGLDDGMIALALPLTVALTIIVVLANTHFGWDRHIWDIPFEQVTSASIVALVAKLAFTLAATFTRLSLCAFYYRLVKDTGIQWFVWVVHATVALTICICAAGIFLTIFLCVPVKAYWEFPPSLDAQCLDEGVVTLVAGVLNIFNDLVCAIVPIPLVMRLRMPLKQRVGVSVLFGLGSVVIVAGAVRTYYIWKGLMASYDQTWYAYPLWIAAAVEIDVGVICACAPALKSLLHFIQVKPTIARRLSQPFRRAPQADELPLSSGSTRPDVMHATPCVRWSADSQSPPASKSSEDLASKEYELQKCKTHTDVRCERR